MQPSDDGDDALSFVLAYHIRCVSSHHTNLAYHLLTVAS